VTNRPEVALVVEHEAVPAPRTTTDDVAVAQALTLFEHAVRRHAAAQTELRVARRPSTTKAALKSAQALVQARLALTAELQRLGWTPPADVSLTETTLVMPRIGE
jgi:hypothetical protein